jgi:membrane protein implicated in regulation of membrane protease activity
LAGYNAAVTLGFAYLLIFLGGFTLSLVTGFARRLLHPTELCDNVVVPSHEHLRGLRFPLADILASFLTLFGFTALVVHGITSLAPPKVTAIGVAAGLIGVFALKSWLYRVCDPSERLNGKAGLVRVVREIPANGYGQVELSIDGAQLKMAARTDQSGPIPVGEIVEILDRTESVVVVKSQ